MFLEGPEEEEGFDGGQKDGHVQRGGEGGREGGRDGPVDEEGADAVSVAILPCASAARRRSSGCQGRARGCW
jgi:hypothetical protein